MSWISHLSERTKRIRIVMVLAGVMALAAGATACGGEGNGSSGDPGTATAATRDATLALDFIPNAVHSGIYRAQAAGYYGDNGISLRIIQPTSTADTLRLIDAGKADFGIADGIDLAGQIDQGREAKGIMAILQRPAGGLITLEKDGIESPAGLAGRTVGVTGVPSDNAVLDTIMADDGSSADELDVVTIGFNGVQALEAGRLAAFTGFTAADGVQANVDGFPTKSFPLDEFGGPSYPGLVAFSTGNRIADDPDLIKGFVEATTHGYRDTLADPARSVDDLVSQTQGVDSKLATAQLDAYIPLMGSSDTYGQFTNGSLEALSKFLVDKGLVKHPIAPGRYATNEYTGGEELTGEL